ncbi:beta-lactamase family protein [Empedobacter falsenii]|uniref:serine hydrolase domain-containing protein n=1 Tax=Empedobacter falsenii TaxID=343874 RepID=UPI00257601B5|nr:serine hydrolase domain-containing protein [Empedobacter falsenii]MDM1298729.1 beta-lactamase family protein [Empedobacter falsenii]MDM1318661.1 beta-lactamase family protein [Empedobacter falsenii]
MLLSINLFAQNFEKETEQTNQLIQRFQKKYNIPGISISISYQDKLIYSKGFGVSNIESLEKVNPSETKFRIASITKSLTALTIGKLIEMDSIDIDKSPYYYLKDLPRKEYDFTIKDVGGHLAGIIRVPTGERYDCKNTYTESDFYPTFDKDRLSFVQKTNFSYSNYGYKLLGLIVERQCGDNIKNCHKKLVLDKLDLKNMIPDDGSILRNNNFYIESKGKNILASCLDCTFKYAQGCYLATSEDIIKFANAILYKNRLLKEETIKKLIKSQELSNGTKTRYGFGFELNKDFYGNDYFGHTGGYEGSTAEYRIYPKKEFVITILTNKSGTFRLNELLDKIAFNYFQKIK